MIGPLRTLVVFSLLSVFVVAGAHAQVGEPIGSFDILVKQGGTTIATKTVTIGSPGADLSDLKATFQDGDPESNTQIGTIGPSMAPIILKCVTEDNALFRLLHMYIDVPVSLADIDHAGPTSLFDPNGAPLIDVTVSGMTFAATPLAAPQVLDDPYFYVSFMRDIQGHFYESPQANPYGFSGGGIYDIQVPGTAYHDGDSIQYAFSGTPGSSVSWTWGGILRPTPLPMDTKVHNGSSSGVQSADPGYVFELGLAVAFTNVPDPTTILLFAPALFWMRQRRRRANEGF